MSHRVLLDFTCSGAELENADTGLPQAVLTTLVEAGWETARGSQSNEIFQRMADHLPEDDLPSFVRNTKERMHRKSPHAELTFGYFADHGVGKVRVRIRADHNAAIAELGKRTATELLSIRDLELRHMDLFESRNSDSIAQGVQVEDPSYRFWARSNVGVSVPLVFALSLLLIGAVVAYVAYLLQWEWRILGDSVWVWYGRLFAPLLMAVVTTGAVVFRDRRRAGSRRAEWEL